MSRRKADLKASQEQALAYGQRKAEEIFERHRRGGWATFISTLNAGDGVPCTLWRHDMKSVPGIRKPRRRADQFKGELEERVQLGRQLLAEMKEGIARGIGKKELTRLIEHALNELGPNLGFVSDQFGEHVEATIAAAKTEIAAYLANETARAGLAALQGEGPLALSDGKDE